MSPLFSALLGPPDASQSRRIPQPLLAVLIVAILAFYLANSFSSPLTALLFQGKWLPLGLLTIAALAMLRHRPAPHLPMGLMFPLAALFVVGAGTTISSVDPAFSTLSWITIAVSVLCGYAVSSMLVATDSRRAYFELLATIGRVFVLITVLFLALGVNLGRGSGPSAWTDNPNTLAALLSPAAVIFIAGCIERRPGWPVKHALFLLLGFWAIWATGARASVIWLVLSALAFWMYRRGPGLTLFIAMIGLVILIAWWEPIREYVIEMLGLRWSARDSGVSPLSGREEVWRVGWMLFQERPIAGYGLGTSQEIIGAEAWRFVRHQGLHFHSSYIMAAVEMGVFGLVALLGVLFATLWRAVGDSARTAVLPRESWPLAALPFSLVLGGMGHALFESWLMAPGNSNMMLFWTWVWMIHHQAQVKVRAVVSRPAPQLPAGAALTAR